jgi:hypothetical protein
MKKAKERISWLILKNNIPYLLPLRNLIHSRQLHSLLINTLQPIRPRNQKGDKNTSCTSSSPSGSPCGFTSAESAFLASSLTGNATPLELMRLIDLLLVPWAPSASAALISAISFSRRERSEREGRVSGVRTGKLRSDFEVAMI